MCVRSDGSFVTAIDWRANRLVDHLARLAALQYGVPELAFTAFKQAMHAAEYCAAFLGTVTHKANHHKVLVTKPDGSQVFSYCRDSAPGKKPPKAPGEVDQPTSMSEVFLSAEVLVKGTKRCIVEVISPSAHPPPRPRPHLTENSSSTLRSPAAISSCMRRLAEKTHGSQNDRAFWVNWNENRSKRPPPTQPAISGADRLAAIRQRLRASS